MSKAFKTQLEAKLQQNSELPDIDVNDINIQMPL
jgi:hypothetical protein